MKTIHYAGEVLMTGDAIADAIVSYAESLARHETSASIEVPVLTESGVATTASFLLGPASQLVAVSVDSQLDEVEDAELVEYLRLERSRLDGLPVPTLDEPDESGLEFDY